MKLFEHVIDLAARVQPDKRETISLLLLCILSIVNALEVPVEVTHIKLALNAHLHHELVGRPQTHPDFLPAT